MSNLVEIIITGKDLSKEAFGEAKKSGSSLGSVMSKVGLMGAAAMAGIAVEAVKMASKFDSEMTLLNTQAGVSKDKLAGLKSGVLDLAGQVGFSPDSLAEALFHVESNFESLGISSTKALSLVKVAAEGAATGHADLVDVTNALTAAVASGIPGVENMSQAMGMLNATVGAGDMKMQDLASAFGSGMVATVKGFGLSLTDVGAALAVFGDNNIRGASAGTQLRMSVMALAKPVSTAGDALKKIGLTQTQLATDMQNGGLLPAMEDLMNHMKAAGVTAKEQGSVITDIFGRKAGAGLNILADQMDRLKSKYPAITAGANNFQNAWETTKKTFAFQMKSMEQGADALMIRLGEKLIPTLSNLFTLLQTRGTPVVHEVSSALSQLAAGFDGNKPAASAAASVKSTGGGQQHGGAAFAPPPVTGWAKAGQTLKTVGDDLEKFGGQALKAGGQFMSAMAPVLALWGSAGLETLKEVGSVLSMIVGPALVKTTGFMDDHKTAVTALITIGLIPLALRLSALAIIKPVVAIATLAADIVKFPFVQARMIGTAVSTGWSTMTYTAGQMKLGAQMLGQYALVGWGKISSGASAAGRGLASMASTSWTALGNGLAATGRGLKLAAVASLDFSKSAALATGAAIKQAAAFVWDKTVTLAATVATKAAAAGQWLLNVALDANPIGAVIILVAALAAGFYELYKRSELVREAVASFWSINEVIAGTAATGILLNLKQLSDGFEAMIGTMVNGAASAFGWMPGIGPKLKQASVSFAAFKASTDSNFDNMIKKAQDFTSAAARATAKKTLSVEISGWTDNLNKAKSQLKSVPPSKKSALLASIADLENKIAIAKNQLASVKSKTVFLNVVGTYTPAPYDSPGRHAAGGPVSAAATGGARGGLTWINEQGPELVRLPTGSMVYPTGQSRAMTASAGGGGGTWQVEWVGGNAGDEFMRWLRKNIRITGGGDVQRALGT